MQCILYKIYFWKVFHKYYNLICIFICTPICTKFYSCKKWVLHIEFDKDLIAEEYAAMMNDNVKDLIELRLWSLEKIKENKAKVARAYNKKVKLKEFQVGDLVWEAVLPLETKDAAYEKWSPNWHGPYRIDQVLPGNAYMLEKLDGVKFPVAVNGQHLKKYFPSMWHDGQ
jgi:hypothetical protein